MTHKPILFKDLSLSFSHKICFEGFSGQIHFGDRIVIIGRNGIGKSTLLRMLQGGVSVIDGEIKCPNCLKVGYLPQIISDYSDLSGGERLNQRLTEILASNPNLLLLDEPTNHLDRHNRRSLIRLLKNYQGTLVIVSHDLELIDAVADVLWHIEAQRVTVFSGTYKDYQQALSQRKKAIEQELSLLSRQRKEAHHSLMREQERNKSSRIRGEKHIKNRKWPTIRSHAKMANAVVAGNKRLTQLRGKKEELLDQLSSIYQPEVILPKFFIHAEEKQSSLITIRNASLNYPGKRTIVTNLNFSVRARERVVLSGDNGSGKTTLVKAILGDCALIKTGEWMVPSKDDIGYLDQHYNNLLVDKTVLETMSNVLPQVPYLEIRKHLNDFLFRKNEEIHAVIATLSGGEKTRLSLALIAANPPKLLILDELTNNLDLETRAHLIQVLNAYTGAMIVISHDEEFLKQIQIETVYQIRQGVVKCN
ncbi:ABC-F family ATP-binding cassette domain-containing protein [Legionella waltersii]|uniref:ABC transporter ATP-binding protein Uup n=1 Tax=Legionella waltersii TaxID=66969 RepID=A0A0W1ANM1_9GAMM|nr:ABC-F family ATP-binding cassette domain-containing protein [Legionella waltersii]KTD82937.1 ABC transporter ATP-binding protein Uup [Legionella waltersii]SNV02426.1 ABC transporter ATP-binding protein [Legionella waltersii]